MPLFPHPHAELARQNLSSPLRLFIVAFASSVQNVTPQARGHLTPHPHPTPPPPDGLSQSRQRRSTRVPKALRSTNKPANSTGVHAHGVTTPPTHPPCNVWYTIVSALCSLGLWGNFTTSPRYMQVSLVPILNESDHHTPPERMKRETDTFPSDQRFASTFFSLHRAPWGLTRVNASVRRLRSPFCVSGNGAFAAQRTCPRERVHVPRRHAL